MKYSARQSEILRQFAHREHATAGEIANALKVSEKTIRNEIREINRISGEAVIVPQKGRGYAIADQEAIKKQALERKGGNSDRRLQILREILTDGEYDYYELADQHYISESTLDHDIQELNESVLKKYDTRITRRKNRLYLDCSEQMRRQLCMYLLMKEVEFHEFDLDAYESWFLYSNPRELKELLTDFFRKNGLHFNDMEALTFLSHIGILIDSVKGGNSLKNFQSICMAGKSPYTDELCHCLEEQYDICLNESERRYIDSLMASHAGTVQPFQGFRNKEMAEFIDYVLAEVESCYRIRLKEDVNFKSSLLLHLVSLVERARQKRFMKNPVLKEIREKFPLLYDISVFIAVELQKRFDILLEEDEIGYITLHLMCLVEKMKEKCFRIAVVDPVACRKAAYYQERLEFCFPNETMEVVCFSAFELEHVAKAEPDFIIMTAQLKESFKAPVLLCSPLLLEPDIQKIGKCIEELRLRRNRNQIVCSQFDSRLFFAEPDIGNKEELIHFMCGELVKYGYCDEHYEELLLERERIAPTSFGNYFAIPHPVKKEAIRPGIAIAVLKKNMDWSGQKVRLVFLFSLAKENESLMKLYEGIVEMLDDKEKVKRLIQKTRFEDFVEEFING